MANTKISELTALTPPDAADLVPVTDSSASQTKRTTVGEIVGIVNGDVDVANDGTATISELPVSKLQDGTARQLLQTDAAGTGVEWTDDVDLPGTLDVTGVATLDNALNVAGLASLDGGIDVDGAFTVANTSGNIATSGTLGVTGQSTLASAAVSDLTSGRVVLAGASGELEDNAALAFNGTQLDVDGDVVITGDLTVEGASTILETETVKVEDKNIELGVVASPTDTTADGGGITLKGATDKTIIWSDATNAWTSSERLDLPAGADTAPALFFNGAPTGIYSPGADQVAISTGGTGRLFVDASGKVGVGATPSGTGQFHVINTTGNVVSQFLSQSSGTCTIYLGTTSTADSFLQYDDSNSFLRWFEGGSERFRIDSSGRLGLGTSSPQKTLHVAAGSSGFTGAYNSRTTAIVESSNSFGTGLSIMSPSTGQSNLGFGDESNEYAGLFAYDHTSDSIRYLQAGQERVRIDSSGRLGLGTSAPDSKLVIQQNSSDTNPLDQNSPSTSSGLAVRNFNFGVGTYTALSLETAEAANVQSASIVAQSVSGGRSPNILFTQRTASNVNTTRMVIDSSGRVGIGVTSPNRLLEVSGSGTTTRLTSSTNTSTIEFSTTGGFAYIGSKDGPNVYVETNGSERARIDSSGRLLVGTSSTTRGGAGDITAQGSSVGAGLRLQTSLTSPADGVGLGYIYYADAGGVESAVISAYRDGGTWTSGSSQPSRLVFSTTADGASSPTERMRIASNGSVATFCSNATDGIWASSAATAGTARSFFMGSYGGSQVYSGTISYRVYTNGDVVNANGVYGAISDIKLKENIVDANSQWDDLKALQVRNYNFKEGQTHTQIGLVAQEVELVSPGLVSESPDRDEEGNDLGTVTKSVNYSVLYMKAVKALQEAMERIETLEADVAALKAQ